MTVETKPKVAPNSKESEMMVLGCMLTNGYYLEFSSEALSKEDFYYTEHQEIFNELKELYRKNKPADVHIICESLKDKDKLKKIGGPAYITTLAQYAGTSAHIEEYCALVEEKSIRRKLISLSQDMEKRALNDEEETNILNEVSDKLKKIEQRKSIKKKFPILFLDKHESNFLLTEPPAKPMLLEYSDDNGTPIGFLPKGIVSMLVGAGGVGKTHLLSQLAISVATGIPWLDTFTTTKYCGEGKKGSVFIGLGENHYDDIHRLLYKASKKIRNLPMGEEILVEASKRIAPFSFCGQQAAFLDEKHPSQYFRELKIKLEDMAPKEGWSLIILDPVSRLMGADAEIDNAAATQFVALLEELTIDLPGNPTILFAHHVSKFAIKQGDKQDQTASRGASAITDGVRWQVSFSKETNDNADLDITTLKMTKSNFTRIMESIKLKKDIEGFLEIDRDATKNNKRKSFGEK